MRNMGKEKTGTRRNTTKDITHFKNKKMTNELTNSNNSYRSM